MAAVILIAAPFLAKAADQVAEQSGMGRTVLGTLVVGLCTYRPEMVTTFAAMRIKSFDMALGNILGSNCLNIAVFARSIGFTKARCSPHYPAPTSTRR